MTPRGASAEARRFLRERGGWDDARVDLLDEGFRRYWARAEALARRAPELAPPRLRNVAVVRDPLAVRPFGQMLNQSTWTMYASDFDPEASSAELVAYLLLHGDRLAQVGEVTFAAVHLAPYWFERSDAERAEFAAAAARSTRPDAAVFRAVAAALPWLRELRHARLRPPRGGRGHRPIPGTGLLVPRSIEERPDALVASAHHAAVAALESFYARARVPDPGARRDLLDWLAAGAPPLLVTARERILWDPERPGDVGALEAAVADAGGPALRDVRADLEVVAARTRDFLASVVDPAALPAPDPQAAQSGYVYSHRERRLLAYDLHERDTDRLLGPAMPYAREMLGARAVHEWAHLAVDAGWVPRALDDAAFGSAVGALAARLDAAIGHAPREVRERGARGLAALGDRGSAGTRLASVFLSRLPDFQSNLLAARLWSAAERETYVRQNVRSLRAEYGPDRVWSMLVRYLYEIQYLGFSAIPDPIGYFVGATFFDHDFLHSRILDEATFRDLCSAGAAICRAHAIDEARFRLP